MSKPRKVAIICGSNADLPLTLNVLGNLCIHPMEADLALHVISCHRNPMALMEFAASYTVDDLYAIVCVGGKAFALPGVLDAWLHFYEKEVPVLGVAVGEGKSLQAAALSIEELPDEPLAMDEATGLCYAGEEGLAKAIKRAVYGDLPKRKPRKEKPARMHIWHNS